MKNFVTNSKIITIISPSDVIGGVPIAIGSFVAVPQYDALKDELIAVLTEGVVFLPITGAAKLGDCLYFHTSDNSISTLPASGICCGFALEPATDNEIMVMLNKSISAPTSVDLSAYFKTADFNATLVKACTDATVKAALKTAVQ